MVDVLPRRSTLSVTAALVAGGALIALVAAVAGVAAYTVTARIFPEATPAQLAALRLSVAGGAGAACLGVLALVVSLALIWHRRVARPAARLIDAARAVAAGDLSRDVAVPAGAGAITRLGEVTQTMIVALRRLTGEIAGSARSTAAMAAEITTGAEQMSAAAGEIASTSNSLSQQATEMAGTLQHVHGDAGRLVAIAEQLATGAREGVERNAQLRLLADENKARLDASTVALATLAGEVASSAAAVEGVAAASEEVRAFVTLVQKMARQSKLLALNAAMEAARAGAHGQGFAVVANEVRRLAASSSDAAARTVAVVNEVLARVAESRASSAQTVHTVHAVLEASREGARTFGEVSGALEVAGRWTSSIADAAAQSSGLVSAMTRQLDTLAHGTDSFAAAMQQVAASSEEQSASTGEIATAAAALATHARRLHELSATSGLDEAAERGAAGPFHPLTAHYSPSTTHPIRPPRVRTAA